ncbi:MAG: hypothetical protein L0Y44_07745 [Phycisphaerales bacterium]|nr:hypothetical protein [Phycisphaerales bacterium]MCI0676108.1 hypothetical protein [Phycisphaerales bacterium]
MTFARWRAGVFIIACIGIAWIGATLTLASGQVARPIVTTVPAPKRTVHVYQAYGDTEPASYSNDRVTFNTNVVMLSQCRPLITGGTALDVAWAASEWNLTRINADTLVILDYEPEYLETTNHKQVYINWIRWLKGTYLREKFPAGHSVRLMAYYVHDWEIVRHVHALHPDCKQWYPDHDPAWIAELRKKYEGDADTLSLIDAMDNPRLNATHNHWYVREQLFNHGLQLGAAWDRPVIPSFANVAGFAGGHFGELPIEQVERSLRIITESRHRGTRVNELLVFGSNPLTDEYLGLLQRLMSN